MQQSAMTAKEASNVELTYCGPYLAANLAAWDGIFCYRLRWERLNSSSAFVLENLRLGLILFSPPLAETLRKLGVTFSLRLWRGKSEREGQGQHPLRAKSKSELIMI